MRWLQELFNPAQRCARTGHVEAKRFREGFVQPGPSWRPGVADRVRQERCDCGRCGLELSGWAEVSRRSIDSLSGPSDMFDAIEAGGYWLRHGAVNPTATEEA